MIGIAHGPRDWLLTRGNTEGALNALYSRAKISRKYDVPDLAGYAENGKDFFIDADVPEECECNGKKVKVDKYLILHEEVEIALIKLTHLTYQDTHQVACLAEKEAVEMVEGMGAWQPYSDFMRKWIDKCWNKKNPKTPPTLYKKPYVDEDEFKKLRQMGYVK
jgi:hypothetical protein